LARVCALRASALSSRSRPRRDEPRVSNVLPGQVVQCSVPTRPSDAEFEVGVSDPVQESLRRDRGDLSLALGIRAKPEIYSLFHELLLHPLPVTDPSRLVNFKAPGPQFGS